MLRRRKGYWLVLAGWLGGACLGGQTGEPTSGHCSEADAPWQVSVNGVSPEQLALAYRGEHRVKLHWSKDPVGITDAVTLTLAPREQSGTIVCNNLLSVPVTFSLQADDGTVIEAGQGSLSAARGMLQPAWLSGRGRTFLIVGTFSQAAGDVIVSGTLGPLVDATSADAAEFSSDRNEFAGSGGI
ncbi:MAG TPA: hypothetical protein VER12_04070 [Polyangiaceae bacterium]|nr:hypothetical protein [Polyangiaceae bacterium]